MSAHRVQRPSRRNAVKRARWNRRQKALTALGVAGTVVCAAGGAAYALWQDADVFAPPAFNVGGVSLSAAVSTPAGTPAYSSDGGPVTVTVPGSVIVQDITTATVIWQFTVSGWAEGIAGMNYTVSYPNPEPEEAGYYTTVLEDSTMKVYQAASGGDCSQVPSQVPTPDSTGTVHLAGDGTAPAGQYVLQSAGAELGTPPAPTTTQVWCVALAFRSKPDGEHVNTASVTGTATGLSSNPAVSQVYALSTFNATIQYPNRLSPVGEHLNVARADGTASNGSTASATSQWVQTLFPDLDNEPDVPITITPVVTTQATAGS